MSTVATTERICYNCGRPQDHRIHDGDRWSGSLTNGCAYSAAQPETLWTAVLSPALSVAAEATGVDREQAFRAVYHAMHRA